MKINCHASHTSCQVHILLPDVFVINIDIDIEMQDLQRGGIELSSCLIIILLCMHEFFRIQTYLTPLETLNRGPCVESIHLKGWLSRIHVVVQACRPH